MKYLFIIYCLFHLTTTEAQSPKPTRRQLVWQQYETTAFLHFTVNTFTGKEWGDGTEDPRIFNPTAFDAGKMIKVLKEAGFKMAIITAKHHDGFCLWPSAYTTHSVKNSPWKNGKGDIVKEIADACHQYGIKFGFYLSPWDRHEPSYGTPAYNTHYKAQLTELLTGYGKVSEVWFDGAKGENAKAMMYDFNGFWQLVRKWQPGAVMFSDVGPDIRWVGNESGNAGETCWSAIDTTGMAPGKSDARYLNTGDPNGALWLPAETDVSIRPGWFYHAAEDSLVKPAKKLVDLYYQSVGRNSLLLLNIPLIQQAVLLTPDVASLKAFRAVLDETFRTNLAKHKAARRLTDNKLKTYVTLQEQQPLEVDFKEAILFDRAMLRENIRNGQYCRQALLEYWDGSTWQRAGTCTTIGNKRLLRFPAITTTKVRITVLQSKQPVQLAEIGFYKASGSE